MQLEKVLIPNCFGTWFPNRLFIMLVGFVTSFEYHLGGVSVFVFVSVEHVVADTPTREIKGLGFRNALGNIIQVTRQSFPKAASTTHT